MAIPGWTHSESPFHVGELAIQARMGVQARMDKQGRRPCAGQSLSSPHF